MLRKDWYLLFLIILAIPVYLLPSVPALSVFLAFLFLYCFDKTLSFFVFKNQKETDQELTTIERELRKTVLTRQLEDSKYQMVIEDAKRATKDQDLKPSKFFF